MSALQVLMNGFITAAELVALLFISPALGIESARAGELKRLAPGVERPRELNLLSSSLDVRLFGSLADVRVSQRFRNDGSESVNLAANLPIIDEYTDALTIHRRDRSVNLLQIDSGCGGDEQSDGDDMQSEGGDMQSPTAGHAQLLFDELLADALQLVPGDIASIEVVARQPMQRLGKSFRLVLPKHVVAEPQAILIDQTDVRFLLVIPHRAERATARLTLRPFYFISDSISGSTNDAARGAMPEIIELGPLSETPTAYVIPLADRAALEALAAGAIELEIRANDRIVWSTLTVVRTEASVALARQ